MTVESGYLIRDVFASLLHFEQNKINGFKVAFLTLRVSVGIKKNKINSLRQFGSLGDSSLTFKKTN